MSSALRFPHPAERIDLELEYLMDQEQLMANNDHDFNIFTDSSKIAALSIWSGTVKTKILKFAFPSYCTVYQEELLPICCRGQTATDNLTRSVGIYSDYLSALKTIINPDATK
ncbi:unnamed protein product [Euphydryas editha]|uniref:Uncharacterized protein n=1 Tax=Euphydryas editha TaxID=104508 RepID=A0AAU9T9V8_EUPED|nr:unnamed protein product [Euphydryas editha]